MIAKIRECVGIENADGNYAIVYADDGYPVTRLDVPNLYPVDNDLSVRYEHPGGIIISADDAEFHGLEIEKHGVGSHPPEWVNEILEENPEIETRDDGSSYFRTQWCTTELPQNWQQILKSWS